MNAAWAGGEDPTLSVGLHAIGQARQALVCLRLHVVEQSCLAWRPARVEGLGQ